MMPQEFERPRITEIQVRMDCNGCVQKIKKALNGIKGIYDVYVDFPQQKATIIGRVDPERIMKAIKKFRRDATICSHTDVPEQNSQPTESMPYGGVSPPDGGAPMPYGGVPPPDGGAPMPDGGAPLPYGEAPPQYGRAPPPEGAFTGQEAGHYQSAEPPRYEEAPPPQGQPIDQPTQPYQADNPLGHNPQPEWNPPPMPADMQPSQPSHALNHNQHDYDRSYGYENGYRPGYSQSHGGQWSSHHGHSYRHEPPGQHNYHGPPHESGYQDQHRPAYNDPQSQPAHHSPPSQPSYHNPPPRNAYHEPPPPQSAYATHSYNMYRPAPAITEYRYVQSPPRYTSHNRTDYYDIDSYEYGNTSNGNVNSIFSDENPNACTIV